SPTSVLIPGGEVVVDLSLWVAASGCRLVARRWAGASAETLVPPTAHTRILKVFSAATGEPLRGARVLAVDATQDESAELRSIGDTDASGRAGFALPAPTASTQVVVSAPGYGTVVVPPPEDGSNEVRLPTAVAARQQVLDPTGGPATHLAVHIEHPGSWLLTQVAFADGGGMVRLELPRGTYGMRPWHPHYLNRARTLLVTGRDDPPPIRCEPGFRVHGRILLPDGKPARGAVVTLRDSTDARVRRRTAVCDRDGGFQISGLPEHARMRLSARLTQSDGRAFISEQIWVQPELEDVELRLKSEDPPLPGRR
ncbi:MAG: carboxypeptidase regulatory-like domain-containing protein, partial [Planctomycetes bacterium]|nr:carboxypeptidase regulatory-like domain-containing protein [Planctomycetota bacterium]